MTNLVRVAKPRRLEPLFNFFSSKKVHLKDSKVDRISLQSALLTIPLKKSTGSAAERQRWGRQCNAATRPRPASTATRLATEGFMTGVKLPSASLVVL